MKNDEQFNWPELFSGVVGFEEVESLISVFEVVVVKLVGVGIFGCISWVNSSNE